MDHKQFLFREKMQVYMTLAALLAAVYFLAGRWFVMPDPLWPFVLLPAGGLGAVLRVLLLLLILAAISAACTLHCRPGCGLMAALVALGGLATRSGPMNMMLLNRPGPTGGVYLQLIAEILLLGLVVMLAEALGAMVRSWLAARRPGWAWRDPLGELSDEQHKILKKTGPNLKLNTGLSRYGPELFLAGMTNSLVWYVLSLFSAGKGDATKTDIKKNLPARLRVAVGCLFAGVLAGVILVAILLQSAQRAQILFSLFAGFMLAGLFAHHLFPVRAIFVAWAMPIIAAVIFYALAAVGGGADRPAFQVLPIDWITAGAGGAIMGFWISGRMRETRIFETLAQAERLSV